MPPLIRNHGNYIASLGQVCRWLAEQAESLGVEIFPGFAESVEPHAKYTLLAEGARGSLSKMAMERYGLR